MNNTWKPKGWIAILFGLFLQPFAFLYVNNILFFTIYFFLFVGIAITHAPLLLILVFVCPAHAFWLARKYNTNKKRMWYANGWRTLLCAVFTSALILSFRTFFFDFFQIPASSMFPTLNPGNHVMVNKWGYKLSPENTAATLKRGEIIVFSYPPKPEITYLKRIIGLPGDTIVYRDKNIYLKKACHNNSAECSNFELLPKEKSQQIDDINSLYIENNGSEQYQILLNSSRRDLTNRYFAPNTPQHEGWTVPDGHFFVMGDNRDNSADSRYWGFVPQQNITGTVIYNW